MSKKVVYKALLLQELDSVTQALAKEMSEPSLLDPVALEVYTGKLIRVNKALQALNKG